MLDSMKRPALALLAAGLCLAATLAPAAASTVPGGAEAVAQACAAPAPALAAPVQGAADAYMTARYPSVFGYSTVLRVQGDWALVLVTPKVQADRAALILQRGPAGWTVVAGPGTAFSPESRPAGMPAALLDFSVCG